MFFSLICCKTGVTKSRVIAWAGSAILRENQTKTWISDKLNTEDSLQLMHNKIKQWAKTELLAQQAQKMIPSDVRHKIDAKVEDYRNELLINYLLKLNKDSIIYDADIDQYYKKYKDNFKLRRNIVKLQYIKLYKDSVDNKAVARVEKLFKSNRLEDQARLRLEGLNRMTDFHLSAPRWEYFLTYYNKFPFPKISNKGAFLKRVKFLRLYDSLAVYLFKILDYKLKGSAEPLEFSREKIRNMLKVQRNTNYIDTLKENLFDQAIQNKTFKIYENK